VSEKFLAKVRIILENTYLLPSLLLNFIKKAHQFENKLRIILR